MPIYEFYCPRCHTIYNFWSKKVDTEKTPTCPQDRRHRLQRKVSAFAVGSRSGEGGEREDLPFDEARMMSAMEEMASEAEGLDEEDPAAAARLMRKLSDRAGIEYGDTMEEALRRMEAGEDPDAIEAELGDALGGEEEPFSLRGATKGRGQRRKPKRDETLYEM